MTDENKLKIVEAGALPHYVQLLDQQREECDQRESAHGLWMLAFKCKDNIIKEPGCLDGRYFATLCLNKKFTLCIFALTFSTV